MKGLSETASDIREASRRIPKRLQTSEELRDPWIVLVTDALEEIREETGVSKTRISRGDLHTRTRAAPMHFLRPHLHGRRHVAA